MEEFHGVAFYTSWPQG